METRLALDTTTVTFEFDPRRRRRTARRSPQLYRVGRILQHVAVGRSRHHRSGAAAPAARPVPAGLRARRGRRAEHRDRRWPTAALCALDAGLSACAPKTLRAGAGRRGAAVSRLRLSGGCRPASRPPRSPTQHQAGVAAACRPATRTGGRARLHRDPEVSARRSIRPKRGSATSRSRGRTRRRRVTHFDRALAAERRVRAGAGRQRGRAPGARPDRRRRCEAFEAALGGRPDADRRCAAASTCCEFHGVQQDDRDRAQGGRSRHSSTRRARRTRPRLPRRRRARSSIASSRRSSTTSAAISRRRWQHAQQAVTLDPSRRASADARRRDPTRPTRTG